MAKEVILRIEFLDMNTIQDIINSNPSFNSAISLFEMTLESLKANTYLDFFRELKEKEKSFFSSENLILISQKRLELQVKEYGVNISTIEALEEKINSNLPIEMSEEIYHLLPVVIHNQIINYIIDIFKGVFSDVLEDTNNYEKILVDALGDIHGLLYKQAQFDNFIKQLQENMNINKTNLNLKEFQVLQKSARQKGAEIKKRNYELSNQRAFKHIEDLWDTQKWKNMARCAEDIYDMDEINLPYSTVYNYIRKYKKLKFASKN